MTNHTPKSKPRVSSAGFFDCGLVTVAAVAVFRGNFVENLREGFDADFFDVAALVGAQDFARAADFQITHRNVEAGPGRIKVFDGVNAFHGLVGNVIRFRVGKVRVGLGVTATDTTAQLV